MRARPAGVGKLGVTITDDYASIARPDTVTLDFTSAVASLEHLEVAAKTGAAIVIGSTGFTPEMEQRAKELAAKTRTVIAPNMSIGVNVLTKIVARGGGNSEGLRRRGDRDSSSHQGRRAERHRLGARARNR